MASIDVAIGGGTRNFSYSIKKIGDNTERFQGVSNDTLFFEHDNTGSEYYELKVIDITGCETTYSFTMNCTVESVSPSWLTVSQDGGVCKSDGTRTEWNIILGGIKNALRYKICYDSETFSCGGDCTQSDGYIDVSMNTAHIPVVLTSLERWVTIRVYADTSCSYYSDLKVRIPAQLGECCTTYKPTIHYDTVKCVSDELAEVRITNRRPGDTVAVRMYGTGMDRFVSFVGDKLTFSTSPTNPNAPYTIEFTSGDCYFGQFVVITCPSAPPPCPDKSNPNNTWVTLYGSGATSSYATASAAQTGICNGTGVGRSLFVENGIDYRVNDRVWVGNVTSTCTDFAPDGYYYVPDSTGIAIEDPSSPSSGSSGSSTGKIIHVLLGKIASITPITCAINECSGANLDVVFLIDESSSILDTDWVLLKNGINLIIDRMSNGLQNGSIQAGIVAFGTDSGHTGPNPFCSRVISQPISVPSLLKSAIDNMVQGKGFTPLAKGLQNAYNLNFTRTVPRKIVVITDGEPNVLLDCMVINNSVLAKAQAETMANTIKANGFTITTVAINVDSVASDWLRTKIASSSSDHYSVSSFEGFGIIADEITKDICS